MAKAKTAQPVPAPIVAGFADLNEQAATVLEALNAIDLDQADRLRHTIEVLDDGSDPDRSFEWRWESGLIDFVAVTASIRKLADSCLVEGDDPTVGCTDKQVTELVSMVRRTSARARARARRSGGGR